MPGVAGLDGSRTYRFAEGSATVRAQDTTPSAAGRVDELAFPGTTVRHLRMLGVQPDPAYGYSLYAVEARDGAEGPDLARGGTATASSQSAGMGPELAVDGNGASRWAVSREDRRRADSWWAVDLGAERALDRVTLRWEAAAGRSYRVQGSPDGERWTDLATGPAPSLRSGGGWLDVDGRAGLVVRGGSEHRLAVYGDTIVPAEGAREPLVIEGHCGVSAGDLSALARRAAPTAGDGRVRAARVDGYLSLFNLSAQEVETRVAVPQQGGSREVYEGDQTVTREGIDYGARLDAASASLLAPRFTLSALSGRSLPSGLRVRVADGATLILSGAHCRLRIEAQGRGTEATVRGGRETRVTLRGAQAFPHHDHALGRNTFPTNPLPPGMSGPGAAVDGDPDTAWHPGRDGRMVVDLGTRTGVRWVEARWRTGAAPAARVEFSTDGVRYQQAGTLDGRGRVRRLTRAGSARYVAVTVQGAPHAHEGLVRLSVG